jgi:very-short-patch-repair endonuclease
MPKLITTCPSPLEGEVGNATALTGGGSRRSSGAGTKRARKLRKEATETEVRLWSCLRRKQLDAFRFRRQQPIGPYVVDFYCPEARLIVELDGGQHAEREAEDAARTAWLEARGYRVLRFWNNDTLSNTEGVLTMIVAALRA